MFRFAVALMCCMNVCIKVHAANADLILHNGRILTVDQSFSIQQAVAVKGGRIAALGPSREILAAERGPSSIVIDLKGGTVLPGLFDSHVHALEAGLSEFRAPLPELHSYKDVQAFIRAQMRTLPKGQWIVVPRTFPTRLAELRMPTRDVLDVATEHPVMYDASYVVIANSFALKMSGITRSTPNPPSGEIVHDDRGQPNGILRNGQSLLKGLKIEKNFSDGEKLQALEDMLKRYLAAGITSVGDRALTPDQIAIYRKLYAEHRLPLRVAMTWRPDILRPEKELLQEIQATPYQTGDGDDWLRFAGFKVNYDGGMTIGTAFQRQPYGPFGKQLYGMTDPQSRGNLFAPPAKLLAIMRAARDKGWQLCAHSQGGGAVDAFLDTMEALNRDQSIAPTRSHLIHASFQTPEAIARAKRLGILVDVQAPWLYLDGPALQKVFGYDGLKMFYPLRNYIDAGIIIAGGSDHMIGHDKNRATNPYNPFLNMWVAVSRKTWQGDVLHGEQRITRAEALKMHTIWAAYLQSQENAKGSLERGKLADMTVIDRDYLSCPEDQIKDITPMMTIVGGKIAYRAH
ncbi:MAG: amidohydrolase [Acidobacteriota bacterium]|nr:amidohydrolase [Acidobacteriota bacterium]